MQNKACEGEGVMSRPAIKMPRYWCELLALTPNTAERSYTMISVFNAQHNGTKESWLAEAKTFVKTLPKK